LLRFSLRQRQIKITDHTSEAPSELFQLAISFPASAVIRKGFGVRPSLGKSIHLPWFAK